MNKVIVVSLDKMFTKFENGIKKQVAEILKILKKDDVAVEIYLANCKLMRKLNKEYRGKNKAANVLSFAEPKNFPHPEFGKMRYLGEIYLNLDYCQMLDIKYQMLIHAILHLFGYTHKKKNDRIKMEKKENYVLNLFRHRDITNQGNCR